MSLGQTGPVTKSTAKENAQELTRPGLQKIDNFVPPRLPVKNRAAPFSDADRDRGVGCGHDRHRRGGHHPHRRLVDAQASSACWRGERTGELNQIPSEFLNYEAGEWSGAYAEGLGIRYVEHGTGRTR